MNLISDEDFKVKRNFRDGLKMNGKIKIYFPPSYGQSHCLFDSTGITNEQIYRVIGWSDKYPIIFDDNGDTKKLLTTVFDIIEPIQILGQ